MQTIVAGHDRLLTLTSPPFTTSPHLTVSILLPSTCSSYSSLAQCLTPCRGSLPSTCMPRHLAAPPSSTPRCTFPTPVSLTAMSKPPELPSHLQNFPAQQLGWSHYRRTKVQGISTAINCLQSATPDQQQLHEVPVRQGNNHRHKRWLRHRGRSTPYHQTSRFHRPSARHKRVFLN